MSIRDKITLLLLVLMSFFLMCDMFITPAIVVQLSAEYQVTDVQLSWIGSGFMLIGATVSLIFGYKADQVNRKTLLLFTVLIGELPCLLTGLPYFTETFSGFAILRILTGIGVGGIYPLTFSLIADYFRAEHRAKACAAIDLAWGIGMVAGPVLAGIALQTEYGWRLAFILAALPNFPLVLLFAAIAREPQRGQTEQQLQQAIADGMLYQQRIKWSDVKLIFSNRSNLLIFLQGIPGSIPWGLLPFWLIVVFSETRQLNQMDATLVWEIFGIATGIGGFLWAVVGDKQFQRHPSRLPRLCMAGVFIGIIPTALLFNLEAVSLHTLLFLAIAAGFLISVPSSNCKAMLMNVNPPEHRGSVFAIYNLCDNIGKGSGPAIGGLLLSASGSYLIMVNATISMWLICGLFYMKLMHTISQDHQQMQQSLRQFGQKEIQHG